MKKTVCFLVLLALAAGLLTACSTADRNTAATSVEQLREPGRIIGVATGTGDDVTVQEAFPDAKIQYFNDNFLGYSTVASGKIDAFVYTKLQMELAVRNGVGNVTVLDETLGESHRVAVGISPVSGIPGLEDKINAFLDELRSDGTLDDMYNRWVVLRDNTMPEIEVPEHASLRLRVATSGVEPLFSYYEGTELRGYDIEMARRFAAWLGAELELKVYDYAGCIAAAQSGDADCIMAELFITPEREEAVRFSTPVFTVERGIMVRGNSEGEVRYTDFSDLSGKTVSMLTGAPFEELVSGKVPDVGRFTYFNNVPDMLLALKTGKTHAVLLNNALALLAVNRNPDLALFPQSLQDGVFGFAFAKGSPERDAWQEAYTRIPEEQKQAVWEKWTGSDESAKVLPAQDWPGSNGTVQAAVCDTLEPMCYLGEGGELIGFDIEMILLTAKELDVHVEFTGMDFSAILSYVQAGKALIGAGSIIVTEERSQAVDFVEYYPAAFVLITRSGQETSENASFWDSVWTSFEKTFIREDRWQLFLSGVGTTLAITVLSILFGTLLGFGVFMLCRNGNPVANALTRFFVWLVQGMPVVVLLMILYYIIFGKVAVSGMFVSVIGFTLVFGAAVYAMIKSGVATVDRGQAEAAWSLGYTDLRAFFRVILPQALPHFMPAYKAQIVALIKATAVVGYVAVQDLTKMGDIVRSRTYDAFFPLIAVAVIYFVLAAVLTHLVRKIEIRIDPKQKRRKALLKGVKTGD